MSEYKDTNARALNWLLGFIIVIMIAAFLNMQFPPKHTQKVNFNKPIEKEIIVKEVETTPFIQLNLTNNEKAALFLLIPGMLVVFTIIKGLGRARKQMRESNPGKVVFD